MLWTWAIIMTLMFAGAVWYSVIVTRKNLELNDQREALVDQIEESLDMLDNCYVRLMHHSEIPVLSDEPIIQDVVRDIKLARNTVLAVASKVVTYGSDEKDTEAQ
jgi:hypothetical protein